jgi:hypothetical protein
MKKTVTIMMCMLLITTTLSIVRGTVPDTMIQNTFSENGLKIKQIDYLFKEAKIPNSDNGRLDVIINEFLEYVGMNEGYLNMFTDKGWVVQNLFINKVPGLHRLTYDFNLGNTIGEDVTSLSVHREFTEHALDMFEDGPREDVIVGDITFDPEGYLNQWASQSPTPMPYLDFDISGIVFNYTKPLLPGENVECAVAQCWTMAVANSLQYLENHYANIIIPHDHVMGLKGDESLVGQLDTYCDRYVVNRSEGGGLFNDKVMSGKFEYLNDIGMGDRITHKHQGHHGGIGPGDFTHDGITSVDESVNGNVTFGWIYNQLKNCSDIEISYARDSGGGHAVRVIGCGRTLGQPWIRYIHDSKQRDDADGLTSQQVYVTDTDGDGKMNCGSDTREIVFALAETGKSIGVLAVNGLVGVSITIENFGPLPQPVSWAIGFQAPIILFNKRTEGTLDIPPHKNMKIKSKVPLGLGPITIIVTVNGMETAYTGFLAGFIIFNFKKG